jgi:histidinol-phosphate aminotransferase
MNVDELARPEIRALRPYVTAEQVAATVRLNANEAPYAPGQASNADGLNRYPAIRPAALRTRLARLFSASERNLLVTRGSSEAIDTLMRAFCRPYTDNIVVTPPTFSMYRVYADIQGAGVISVPLNAEQNFSLDRRSLLQSCTADTKLIFICSPNNPTGGLVAHDDILALAKARAGQSLVVADEAYIEFSATDSVAASIGDHDNLVVLRTLSKAWGLAGARCGALLANPGIVELLERIVVPYSFSAPSTDCILEGLADERLADARTLIERTVAERERLRACLSRTCGVQQVWPSDSNFLLVRFDDLSAVHERVSDARILIREFADDPLLANCARITVGSRRENDQLLTALDARTEIARCP